LAEKIDHVFTNLFQKYRQSFMEWLNLEGIGNKKKKKLISEECNISSRTSRSPFSQLQNELTGG
jgi:hypothetical protein